MRRLVVAGMVALGAAACGDGPSGPELPDLEVVPVAGNGTYVAGGATVLLEAIVRRVDGSAPQKEVDVAWRVEAGGGALEGTVLRSDEAGRVRATLRAPSEPGETRVRVEVVRQSQAAAEFVVRVAEAPFLSGLDTDTAAASSVVTLTGEGFAPEAAANVVLFSGIRGAVRSAAPDRLEVEVPPCLPDGDVDVRVQLGSLASEAVPLHVRGGTEGPLLPPGGWLDVTDPAGAGCLRLEGRGEARYLVVASSTGTVGGAAYDVTLRMLTGEVSVSTAAMRVAGPARSMRGRTGGAGGGEVAVAWHDAIRRRERVALRTAPTPRPPRRAPAAARVPRVGERRSFSVLNRSNEFSTVEATARFVGSHAALFVDHAAPADGLSPTDLAALGTLYDDLIHETVTSAYGEVSDLDANQRVVILFTPVVNALTPRGSNGFVGGFFFGVDLLPDREGSNGGEVFYALVPDETGQFSDPRPRDKVLEALPAVLAHELQHMVHFNQRVLLLGGSDTDALWLSEGLAQMAEELVARRARAGVSEGVTDPALVDTFRRGNVSRARSYLADPAAVSLLVASGPGSLAERGGGWLFVLWLTDRFGENVLGRLTATTRTGVSNVEGVTGEGWDGLLQDWLAGLYLESEDAAYSLGYPGIDLDSLLVEPPQRYPLDPEELFGPSAVRQVTLRSSSGVHYILVPGDGWATVLRLGGAGEGPEPDGARLRLRVLRLF